MASITINIPDNQLQRVVDGLCEDAYTHGIDMDGTLPTIPKAQYARERLIAWIKGQVRNHEYKVALRVAQQAIKVSETNIT